MREDPIPNPKFAEGETVRQKPGPAQQVIGVEWSPPQQCYFYELEGGGHISRNVREHDLEQP